MHIFYLDESGDTGVLSSSTSSIQPIFTIGGFSVSASQIPHITNDFILLKRLFFPSLFPDRQPFLDSILTEIKGADLRRVIRKGGRNKVRHVLGFLGKVLALLESVDARIYARVWVKPIGGTFNGRAVYTYSVQDLAARFQSFLDKSASNGIVIVDSRTKGLNTRVSHSVFTQKFRSAGDAFPRIAEMPVFGHSDNHAGIQIADLLCSALFFPMAAFAYCLGAVSNVHVDRSYQILRDTFGLRLHNLQYKGTNTDGTKRWGIIVSDNLSGKSPLKMFFP